MFPTSGLDGAEEFLSLALEPPTRYLCSCDTYKMFDFADLNLCNVQEKISEIYEDDYGGSYVQR